MIMQRQVVLLAALFAAFCASSEQCLRPVIRVPRDAETTGSYIAVLQEDTSRERLLEIVELLQACTKDVRVHGYVEVAMKAIILDLSNDALQQVRNLPDVKYVEEEGYTYGAGSGSGIGLEPFSDTWYLDRIDQVSGHIFSSYHSEPEELEGVDVYILDSGIRFTHEEFVYGDKHNEFQYRAKYAGFDPVDQDAYYYHQGTPDYVPMRGADCHGHGTAVASLVGGKDYGVAKSANLYSVRVLQCNCTAPSRVILYGLDFIAQIVKERGRNAIILVALSCTYSEAINEDIKFLSLYKDGIVVITAAGNDRADACERSPSSSPYAITVGATDRYDNIAETSNFGPCVDLFAPGVDILAASNDCDSCSDILSGSTLSAAITAGVAAAYASQVSRFTPASIKDMLLLQAIPGVITIPEDMQSKTPNLLLQRGCGGVVSVSVTKLGVITSPGFPGNYPSNTKCKWTLVAELDCDNVIVSFTQIILEEGYDKLSLCLRDECSEEEKVVLTGDHGVPDCEFESYGRFMTIEIMTDSFTEAPGFNATHLALAARNNIKKERCKSTPSSIHPFIQLDVSSSGNEVGNYFSMMKNWNEFHGGIRGGINVAVMDEVTGSVISTKTFATYSMGPYYSTEMANFINSIPHGKIVCTAVSSDGTSHLYENGKRALMAIGSDKFNQVPDKGSWAVIGVKGYLRGQALEDFSETLKSTVSTRIALKPFYHQFVITAESVKQPVLHNGQYKYAIIMVNNTVLDILHNGYGLHVVVLNGTTGEILDKQVFNTSIYNRVNHDSVSKKFVDLINSTEIGTIIAVAISYDGSYGLSEEAKQACESIGSALIRQVQRRGLWAIVGRKGAEIGSVPESASSIEAAKSTYILTPHIAGDVTCQIDMHSVNPYGIGSKITVNGATVHHHTPSTRGHLIALLKDGECSVERNISFIKSDDLLDFIKDIPPGRTVLVNMAYHIRGQTDYGIAALGALGSTKIRVRDKFPWAIIGKKGGPKLNVVEQSYSTGKKTLTLHTSVRPVNTTFVSVRSSGYNISDYGIIQVNNQTFTMPPANDSGLVMMITLNAKHHSLHMTSSRNIKAYIESGSVVAMVTNDAGALNQSDEVKKAIEELGGTHISESTAGGSWALIASPLLEAASNNGPVEIVTHNVTPEDNKREKTCSISVESAATGVIGRRQLTINGRSINSCGSSDEDGLMLAVMKQESCELESCSINSTHNNYSRFDMLASAIDKLPAGTIVIASVYGTMHKEEYRPVQHDGKLDNMKLAMESIGSYLFSAVGYRGAWAIIGRKGAAQGSVPESFVSESQSSAVAVGGVMTLSHLQSCKNGLYSLDCHY